MRRQELQNPIRPIVKAASLPATLSRFMLTMLALLSLGLMLASRAAVAEPTDLAISALAEAPPPAALALVTAEGFRFDSASFPEASAELTAPPAKVSPPAALKQAAVPVRTLDDLLAVRATPVATPRHDTDATIAAAVAEGSRPDLEPKKPFRKKNFDLFRTEREVEILRNDMLLRLRLRAKSRETMSVELRF